MAVTARQNAPRGVYAFVVDDEIIYVGSSSMRTLKRVEYNHRNAWKIPGYTVTYFRSELIDTYRGKGTFRWIVEPFNCNQRAIEEIEKTYINLYNPRCNIDKDPVRSSRRYRRY